VARGQAKANRKSDAEEDVSDPLMVRSVAKAFRVLSCFGAETSTRNLTQIASACEMDISAAQRFTHTLVKLGYLRKDADTKRFELTTKTLVLGHHYLRGSRLIARAMPYLLHLSKETEETVNLTVLDDTQIVFISRFMSRHVLNIDVTVGASMPAYCAASGVAILSRLDRTEALAILERSELKPYTQATTWRMPDLIAKLETSARQGFATAFEEFYHGDGSVAAAILDANGRPEGAINVAVSLSRYSRTEIEKKFPSLVVAAARAISQT
jgi:IclR family pca regulon transcriptional regulator